MASMIQRQREALVELLLLGMFANRYLSVSQDQKILSLIQEIGWQSYQAPDLYFHSAIAKVRDASETNERTRYRLHKISEALGDAETRALALNHLVKFLALDGAVDLDETNFLQAAKTELGF
jgi:hypothetical protein